MSILVAWLALTAALALAGAAGARERIDVVTLKVGDRINCEIVELRSGYLTVRTRSFGTVEIEWVDVETLVSIQYFELEFADGMRLIGSLDAGEQPGYLALHTPEKGVVFQFPHDQIFAIRQLGSSIWSTRRGKLNLGLDYGHSDESTQFSLDATFAFQGKRFRWTNSAQSSMTDDDEGEAKERDVAWSDLEMPIARHWSWAARLTYERNTELDLESRVTAAGSIFWLPWRSEHGRFTTGAGLAESEEDYLSGGSSAVTYGVVIVGLEYYRFGPFGTQFNLEAAYLPALSGPSRYRYEVRSSFTQKIASDFNVSVSPYYSYDSRTPIEGSENEDWGWIASVGWIF